MELTQIFDESKQMPKRKGNGSRGRVCALLLCLLLLVSLTACGSKDPLEGLEVISKEQLDSYGYGEDGRSLMEAEIQSKTVRDAGDYYEVRAILYSVVKVPGNLEMGDTISVVVNDLTGEEKEFTRKDDGNLYDKDNERYFYMATGEEEMVELYMFSGDALEKPTLDGILRVNKDATYEMVLLDEPEIISEDRLSKPYWYNAVYFDENGYVTRLCLVED